MDDDSRPTATPRSEEETARRPDVPQNAERSAISAPQNGSPSEPDIKVDKLSREDFLAKADRSARETAAYVAKFGNPADEYVDY